MKPGNGAQELYLPPLPQGSNKLDFQNLARQPQSDRDQYATARGTGTFCCQCWKQMKQTGAGEEAVSKM